MIYYVRRHQNEETIHKLHTNQPLTEQDVVQLEEILWSETGSKEYYVREYRDKPLGELVRKIVGLDMNAAKEAFAGYLSDVNSEAVFITGGCRMGEDFSRQTRRFSAAILIDCKGN